MNSRPTNRKQSNYEFEYSLHDIADFSSKSENLTGKKGNIIGLNPGKSYVRVRFSSGWECDARLSSDSFTTYLGQAVICIGSELNEWIVTSDD